MADPIVSLHNRLGTAGEEARRASLRPRHLALVCFVLLGGCAGYQVGTSSLYSPHVRTVYVPMFQSDSYRRNLSERLTEAVMKEIEAKTPYKVVGTPNADSTLTGRITKETKRVAVQSRVGDPRDIDVDLQVRVAWIDRAGSPIRESQAIQLSRELLAVGGNAPLFPELGQSVSTAQQQAIQRLAEQIVGMMEAPW